MSSTHHFFGVFPDLHPLRNLRSTPGSLTTPDDEIAVSNLNPIASTPVDDHEALGRKKLAWA